MWECVCMLKACPCPSQLSLSNWEQTLLWMKLKAHRSHHSFLICRRFTLNAAGFLWFPVSKGSGQAKDITAKPCRRSNYSPRNTTHTTISLCAAQIFACNCHLLPAAAAAIHAMKICAHIQLIRWPEPEQDTHRGVCLPLDKQLIALTNEFAFNNVALSRPIIKFKSCCAHKSKVQSRNIFGWLWDTQLNMFLMLA